jgi:hypothetical protein
VGRHKRKKEKEERRRKKEMAAPMNAISHVTGKDH